MNQSRINDNFGSAMVAGESSSEAMGLPIRFGSELSSFCFPIKIKLLNPMNHSNNSPAKLIPGLFHLAASADEPESVPALKNALASGRKPLGERMLDPQKLEAVLNSVTRRKKSARTQEKRLALSMSEAA
jgi:hypothetical protein